MTCASPPGNGGQNRRRIARLATASRRHPGFPGTGAHNPAAGLALRRAVCQSAAMEFRHSGLRRLWEQGDASRLNPDLVNRIASALDDLAAARRPGQMNLPRYRMHQLTGNRRGVWSVRVSGNW